MGDIDFKEMTQQHSIPIQDFIEFDSKTIKKEFIPKLSDNGYKLLGEEYQRGSSMFRSNPRDYGNCYFVREIGMPAVY